MHDLIIFAGRMSDGAAARAISGNDQEEQQNGASSDTATTTHANDRRREENQILTELSATVNTLTSISEVLDDIVASSTNVAQKQELLLEELRKWKNLT